jgi:hypothetical protein
MYGILNKLKFVHNMSADIIKFVCRSVICGRCSSIDFYNGSYQEGRQVYVLVANTVFNNPPLFLCVLMMLSKSLKLIKIVRNMSEL